MRTRSRVKAAFLGLIVLPCLGAVAEAETVQRGQLRVHFEGKLAPRVLPRSSEAPVRVSVLARIASTSEATPPQLKQLKIAINRYGHIDPEGLPVCRQEQIQPATTADALAVCGRSLVGEGSFNAKVLLKGQAPFPSVGEVYAFNGQLDGKPAILAHVYGTKPAPTSYTLPFVISRAHGAFGTTLKASLPQVTSDAGYITRLSLTLGRNFSYRGERHTYLSASCPAPKGFQSAIFPFVKASFGFAGQEAEISSTLTRSCRVR